MPETCPNCPSEGSENYCSICGQPKVVRRIDGDYLIQEIRSILSFEKGLLYTVRELAINPGKTIKGFLIENRTRLVKPVLFLIITSLIYTAANKIFPFEDSYAQFSGDDAPSLPPISTWIQENYGYANIIMAIFIAGWVKLFFRKHEVNIFEIMVLLCFVMGMGMLVYALFGVIQSLIGFNLMPVAVGIGFIYLTWAIGQFYGKGKVISYVKAFFAYILGMISFSITVIAFGIAIELLTT